MLTTGRAILALMCVMGKLLKARQGLRGPMGTRVYGVDSIYASKQRVGGGGITICSTKGGRE